MRKFLFQNLRPGDVFGINEIPLRLHIITFVKQKDDNLYFFDSTSANTIVLKKDNFIRGLNSVTSAPYATKTPVIEHIENLPKSVFEVVKGNTNIETAQQIKLKFEKKK